MYKSCSRCGKIHDTRFKCNAGKIWKQYDLEERKLRATYDWQQKSLSIREQAQWLCEVCRDQGIYTYDNLEVHHIEKLRERPDLFLDDSNLICLCRMHHKLADQNELSKDYLKHLTEGRGGHTDVTAEENAVAHG